MFVIVLIQKSAGVLLKTEMSIPAVHLGLTSRKVFKELSITSIEMDSDHPSFVKVILNNGSKLKGSFEKVTEEILKRAVALTSQKYQESRKKSDIDFFLQGKWLKRFERLLEKHTRLIVNLKFQFEESYSNYLKDLIVKYQLQF